MIEFKTGILILGELALVLAILLFKDYKLSLIVLVYNMIIVSVLYDQNIKSNKKIKYYNKIRKQKI